MEFLSPGKGQAIIFSDHPPAEEYGYTIYGKE
jgi:hypothetical protein